MGIINQNTFTEYCTGKHNILYYYHCLLGIKSCTCEEWLLMIETCEKDKHIIKNEAVTTLLKNIHQDVKKLTANSMFTVKQGNMMSKILTQTEDKTLSTLGEEEIPMTLGEQGTTINIKSRVSQHSLYGVTRLIIYVLAK